MIEISGAYTACIGGIGGKNLRTNDASFVQNLATEGGGIARDEAIGWVVGAGVLDDLAGAGLRRLRGAFFASADDATLFTNRVFMDAAGNYVDDAGKPSQGL